MKIAINDKQEELTKVQPLQEISIVGVLQMFSL